MNKLILLLIISLVGFASLVQARSSLQRPPFYANITYDKEKGRPYLPLLTLVASASEKVKKDVATIALGIKSTGKDVAALIKNNTNTLNKFRSALNHVGVKETEISAFPMRIKQKYSFTWNHELNRYDRNNDGFEVFENITVSTKRIELLGDILTHSSEKGLDINSDIIFSVDHQAVDAIKDKLVVQAVNDLKAQAPAILEPFQHEIDYIWDVKVENDNGFRSGLNSGEELEVSVGIKVTVEFVVKNRLSGVV